MLSFHVKFVQTDGPTDRQTDRRTTVKQYAPDLLIRGHKKKNMGKKEKISQQYFPWLLYSPDSLRKS